MSGKNATVHSSDHPAWMRQRHKTELDKANKYMLMGVEWTLKKLGCDGGMLDTWLNQEFQDWLKSAESPIQHGILAGPSRKGDKAREMPTRPARH